MLMFIQHVVNDLEHHASELPLFKVQEVPATVFTFLAIKCLRSGKLKLKFKRGKRKIELSYDSSQSLAQLASLPEILSHALFFAFLCHLKTKFASVRTRQRFGFSKKKQNSS